MLSLLFLLFVVLMFFSLARAIGILPFFVFGWRLRGFAPGGRSAVGRWLDQPPSRVLLARILAVEHAAETDLGGDQSRRYGDTAITFCYAP